MAEDQYVNWVLHRQHVDAKCYSDDTVHGQGWAIAYAADPTLIIRRADGTTFSWIAGLCEPSSTPDDEPAAGRTAPPEVDGIDVEATEVPLGILSAQEAAALEEFTLALAAADRAWNVAVGDQDMAPAYIRAVARTLWQLWARPTLAKREAELVEAKDLAERRRQQLNHQASGYVRNLNEVRRQGDAEVSRLRELVGDEDVDGQWAGISRAQVIALAEEHYAAAERLRNDRAAMWELLKRSVRTHRETGEQALAEWRAEVTDRDASIERLHTAYAEANRCAQRDRRRAERSDGEWLRMRQEKLAQLDDAIKAGEEAERLEQELDEVRASVARVVAERDRLQAELSRRPTGYISAAQWDQAVVGVDPAYPDGPLVIALRCADPKHEETRQHFDGLMAAVAVATGRPQGTHVDGLVDALAALVAERDRLRLEVASARSIADEKRAVAEELRNEADDRKDERDEAREKLYEIRALALRELDFDDEAAASEPTSELVLEIARRWRGTCAERDRLRQELDLAIQQRQNVARAVAQALSLPIGEDKKPAEPRRWLADAPEPEVGTTVRYVNHATHPTYTRRADGQWHCDAGAHDPNACIGSTLYSWEQITGRSALMPLVEVVSTDG